MVGLLLEFTQKLNKQWRCDHHLFQSTSSPLGNSLPHQTCSHQICQAYHACYIESLIIDSLDFEVQDGNELSLEQRLRHTYQSFLFHTL